MSKSTFATVRTKRSSESQTASRNLELGASSPVTRDHGSVSKAVFITYTNKDVTRNWKARFRELVHRVKEAGPLEMYDAIEQGVPTSTVLLISAVFGAPRESVMDLIGVTESTFRRKEEAGEPLPEVAGHRVMAFLRIVAKLSRLLEESGDAEELKSFDLEGWVREWLATPLPEFSDKTPADMLRNPEGQRAVEELLERMRGGLPA